MKKTQSEKKMGYRVSMRLYELAYPKPKNNPFFLLMSGAASLFMLVAVLILATPTMPTMADEVVEVHNTQVYPVQVQTVAMTAAPVISAETSAQISEKVGEIIKESITEIGPGISTEDQYGMEPYDATVYIAYNGEVNQRSMPSTEAAVIGSYNYRDEVHVTRRGNGWLKTVDGSYIYENSTSAEKPPIMTSLGTFKITAYCSCSYCCGKNAVHGLTRTGTVPRANYTISVDPKLIPLGSLVMINGQIYRAEDTGSAIKGNIIDMYFDTHQQAKNFGVQYFDVYVLGWD